MLKVFNMLFYLLLMPGLSYGMGTPDTDDIAQQIEAIKKKYNITDANSCQAALSKEQAHDKTGRDLANHELACMISGFKDVYIPSHSTMHEELQAMDSDIKKLLSSANINSIEITYPQFDTRGVIDGQIFYTFNFEHLNALIAEPKEFYDNKEMYLNSFIISKVYMYTPKGERNALLLAKFFLETANQSVKFNTYIVGYLLNYKAEDILFFHRLPVFLLWFEDIHGNDALLTKDQQEMNGSNYNNWRDLAKSEFLRYEKDIWPFSEKKSVFDKQVKESHAWLEKNKDKSTEELRLDITFLMKSLKEQALRITHNISVNLPHLVKAFQDMGNK